MVSKSRLPILAMANLLFAVRVLAQAPPQTNGEYQLAEGDAKDVVATACTACHTLDRLDSVGFDRKGWVNIVTGMLNNGAAIPRDQVAMVTEYLIKNYPEKPMPPAAVLPGPIEISIKEWPLPTIGIRPHDTFAASDGAIWYAGQFGNVVGRLDPKTGEFKEYHPKLIRSGPHGIVGDKSGNIWFTANFKGYIGKLNPTTGNFIEYRLPDPLVRDPHTLIFDQKGILWFTAQVADKVGRLDPDTGEIKLIQVPTRDARPYGIAVNSQGIPYFVEFGSNKIASIDPETLKIREFALPNAESRPRRLAISSDDVIWYSDYSRGYLGRYDTKTGKVREWPSPGGAKSAPYGIAITAAGVWYSEAGVRPNTIVHFDPQSEKFQTWKIPSGGIVVRNMMATSEGNLVMACSGANGLALVTIKPKMTMNGEIGRRQ